MYLPTARRDQVTVRELTDETLIYDLARHKAHCLNRTAALIWRHCDGQTTAAELAVMLQRELQTPANEVVVQLALEQLGRRQLLEAAPPVLRLASRSRREMLKTAAAVALLPVVMTVTAPKAAAAASGSIVDGAACTRDADCTPVSSRCCNGFCTSINSAAHCGACNAPCASPRTCTGFICLCEAGHTLCGDVCVNTQGNNSHCGGCGISCPIPTTACVAGTCRCPGGLALCGGACVNTQADTSHCGACNNVCSEGTGCFNGVCV